MRLTRNQDGLRENTNFKFCIRCVDTFMLIRPHLIYMRILETKIPPPIVMTLCGGLAWAAARYLPALSFHLPFFNAIAITWAVSGFVLNVYPKLAFKRNGTTVNPLKPGSTTYLVTSGIYCYTRNPMYLGHSMLLLSWSLYLQNLGALLTVPAFIVYITRFQILPEERHLSARFPIEYAAFCKQAPRWL